MWISATAKGEFILLMLLCVCAFFTYQKKSLHFWEMQCKWIMWQKSDFIKMISNVGNCIIYEGCDFDNIFMKIATDEGDILVSSCIEALLASQNFI